MSSEKGNVKRTRAQKYKNKRKFQNDLHDKTEKTKFLNNLEISDVCPRCCAVLEWRIKFKKYKLLKKPRTCIKCSMKNVTLSYRIMCSDCATKLKVCPKCTKSDFENFLNPDDLPTVDDLSAEEEDES